MAKISLSKSELAVLDALIAEMQESEGTGTATPQEVDVSAQAMFIGAIAKVVAKAAGIAAKATPIAVKATPMVMQAVGRVRSAQAGPEGVEAEAMNSLLSEDGETLSVDKLIALRKSFN
ncbi:hypothetical protein GCM10028819_26050 [Spirosoma humi]